MRVVLAGGIFRESAEGRSARQPAPEAILSRGLRALGVDVVELPLERFADVGWRQPCDLVHVHHLSKAAVAASLGRRSVPIVFTEHAMGLAPKGRERWGQRLVLARADQIVCLSRNEFEEKQRLHHVPARRMTIIPNGFNNLAGRVGMRERHLPDSPARLLFVGQLKDIKQVDRILVAVSEWEGITLRLVYHNAELESELRALVTKLGIEDRAVFVGQRWGSQLLDEYLAADLLVLPSRSESLPSVVAEALACGLPIVASEVGGIAEQVGGAGVLVAPSRSVPIVGALRSAVAGYEALARRARERAVEVQDQFSAEVMADRHLELYERLLGST